MQSHAWTQIRESAESLILFGDLVFRDAEFGWGMCRDVVLGLRGEYNTGRTHHRIWALLTAHSKDAPFLLLGAAARVLVSAQASLIRSSTVSVRGWA